MKFGVISAGEQQKARPVLWVTPADSGHKCCGLVQAKSIKQHVLKHFVTIK